MESKGKHRGFIKGKLVKSLYRAAKPNHPAPHTLGRDQLMMSSHTNHHKFPGSNTTHVDFIIKQDQVNPQPKQKVSFFIPDKGYEYYSKFEDVYGDESVDLKAATYISTVQERFKLERSNSEYNKFQQH